MASIYPDLWREAVEDISVDLYWSILAYILTVLFMNAIPDYVSLLESRYLLGMLIRKQTLWMSCAFIIIDIFATIAIWIFLSLIFYPLFVYILTNSSWIGVFEFLSNAMKDAIFDVNHVTVFIIKVTFFSTFFTSFWLWMYLISGLIIRLLKIFLKGKGKIIGFLDIENSPIISLGFISCLLVTVVFLVFASLVI